MAHPEAGVEVLEKVWPMLEEHGDRDSEPKLEGRFVNMMVLPKKD
jgi:translation initiation factor IF-3